MSEDTAKKVMKVQTPRYNNLALGEVAIRYGVTKTYVRQCVNGIRTGITCDTLKKEYHANVAKIETALKS